MGDNKLQMIALGDTEQVGSSCYAYINKTEDGKKEIILIDFGVDPMQIVETLEGEQVQTTGLPDLEWLQNNRSYVKAVFLTHGHLDHIGAMKYYHSFFLGGIPIYASKFTADLVRRELSDTLFFSEERIEELKEKVKIVEFDANKIEKIEVGGFSVTHFPVPHSIPEACGFMINTRNPFQTVVHLADFKFNGLSHRPKMVLTRTLDLIGKHGIDYLVIESLYSRVDSGYTPQENLVFSELFDLIMALPDSSRVIVSHFASNVPRMREVADIAGFTGLKFALLGKAMKDMFRLAQENSFISKDVTPAFEQNAGFILATGSQGEPRSILVKASQGKNGKKGLKIREGDVIIFSSDVIPGNEQDFIALVEALAERGAAIFVDENSYFPEFDELNVSSRKMLHVSGHGTWTDKRRAIELIRPKKGVVPMHGDQKDEEAFMDRVKSDFPALKTASCQSGLITFE